MAPILFLYMVGKLFWFSKNRFFLKILQSNWASHRHFWHVVVFQKFLCRLRYICTSIFMKIWEKKLGWVRFAALSPVFGFLKVLINLRLKFAQKVRAQGHWVSKTIPLDHMMLHLQYFASNMFRMDFNSIMSTRVLLASAHIILSFEITLWRSKMLQSSHLA